MEKQSKKIIFLNMGWMKQYNGLQNKRYIYSYFSDKKATINLVTIILRDNS
jgi:hypothetical protein